MKLCPQCSHAFEAASDVLEHIAEDETVLRQAAEALRPSGGLLITVPRHQFLWSATDVAGHHVRRYSAGELREKVERAGFRVLRLSSFVSLLMPTLFLSLLRARKPESAHVELNLNPFLNGFLGRVMRIEESLIRRGLDLPAGGSLLLAARKL